MPDDSTVEAAVREHYAAAAVAASACCPGESVVDPAEAGVFGASRYDAGDVAAIPTEALAASIGCANPVALAELTPGEIVLDLGSGGGIDVLLSARRVGPAGKAYGLDMTDEMLDLARANQRRAGVANVEFLKGRIEQIPMPPASVDVVLSNCVINLSTNKAAVFAETYRVLRPGGRLCIADVVADAADSDASDPIRDDMAAWVGCLAGAVTREVYRRELEAAGFVDISIRDSHPVADGFTSVLVRAQRCVGPNAILAEMAAARDAFRHLAESDADALRRLSNGTRWTNQQLLFHMLFGYLIVRALLPLVRLFGVLPESASRAFAAALDRSCRPFNWINYRGSVAGSRLLRPRRMATTLDRVITALQRRLEHENDSALRRGMHFPTSWDPFFRPYMTLADLYHYPTQHFDFHRQQLTL